MLILALTTDRIEAVLAAAHATNPLRCVASWRDLTPTGYTPGRDLINTNGATDVALVGSPAASTQRVVDWLSVYNTDTVAHDVTVKFDANGTEFICWRGSLAAREKLEYTDAGGFVALNSSGIAKSATIATAHAPSHASGGGDALDAAFAAPPPIGLTPNTGAFTALTNLVTVTALADAAATLTGAQMLGGLFTITPTTPRILTTDTAANIISEIAGSVDNASYVFTVSNLAGFDVTLAAGAGVTLVGKAIISNGAATWRARRLTATTVAIIRLGGMFNISAAKRMRSTAQSIIDNTTTIIVYDTLVYDNLGELDATGRFTAKAAGIYHVSAAALLDSAVWTVTGRVDFAVWKNGSQYASGIRWVSQVAHTSHVSVTVSVGVSLVVGDFIDIRINHNQGTSVNTFPSGVFMYFSVNRVA